MKNSTYWQKRFEELEKSLNRYGLKAYAMIQPEFDKAAREINLEIEKWLNRIAKNNEISMSAARKLLDKGQLEEFKWSVEEYIKYGQLNAMNQQWMKQLENASAKYHISRLEALKLQTQQAAEVAFGNYLDSVDSMARQFYSESYYRSAFELQKGFGIGWALDSIDDNKLSKLIAKPWAADGKNFSDRIWTSKSQMVNDLHSELTRTCILGKAPDKAIDHMSKFVNKKFKNAKVQAGRLVMTEQAFFSAAAQKDCFNDLGVEEFEIVATLDSHTSAICQELDGKHFPMSQYEPGVTAPPFHVWCRSTTCPYFDDEFSIGGRAARDADGKTYYVPSNMTYKEWKSDFVTFAGNSNGSKRTIEELSEAVLNTDSAVSQYISKQTKWNGNLVILNDNDYRQAGKRWDCSIELKMDTTDHQLIHEHLHARSISYYDPATYIKYSYIEELPVELLARQICIDKNIAFTYSSNYNRVEDLLEIKNALSLQYSDLEFALALFNVSVPDRGEWLKSLIINNSSGFTEYNRLMKLLEEMKRWPN
jgi:SPP1 gp7 family putative phage head morphogenesis protein